MSGNTKNLRPLSDSDLLWLVRNRVENPIGLGEYEKLWLAQLADRFEVLTKEGE